jgi:hypothetical protein
MIKDYVSNFSFLSRRMARMCSPFVWRLSVNTRDQCYMNYGIGFYSAIALIEQN